MDPSTVFCPNPECRRHGERGAETLRVHSRKERRFRCAACGTTVAATTGTALHRLRTPAATVVVVVTLLAHGCPLQAIVAAFGLDERTVRSWATRAGHHCAGFHAQTVLTGRIELGHVQADEIWARLLGLRVWLALALAVPSRLWLGAAVGTSRDRVLIATVADLVCRCARHPAFLVCTDGLGAYWTAFRRRLRRPLRTGKRGRPRLVLPDGFLFARVVKQYAQRRVVAVERRVVHGTAAAVRAVLRATWTGADINTAYIERLNATFRARIAPLGRRCRRLVGGKALLAQHVYLVGTLYNFCTAHRALDRWADGRWERRTPAMAAGLTDRVWTAADVLSFPLPAADRHAGACRWDAGPACCLDPPPEARVA